MATKNSSKEMDLTPKMSNVEFIQAYTQAVKDGITVQELAQRTGYSVTGVRTKIKTLRNHFEKKFGKSLPELKKTNNTRTAYGHVDNDSFDELLEIAE